jgi:hypothetical protein
MTLGEFQRLSPTVKGWGEEVEKMEHASPADLKRIARRVRITLRNHRHTLDFFNNWHECNFDYNRSNLEDKTKAMMWLSMWWNSHLSSADDYFECRDKEGDMLKYLKEFVSSMVKTNEEMNDFTTQYEALGISRYEQFLKPSE